MPRQVTIVAADKIEYTTGMVVVICYRCAVPFAMPRSLNESCRADADHEFFCPNGHGQVYGESEADRLKRKLAAATRRADAAEVTARRQRNRAIDAERSRSAYKAVATRQRNRIARGVCPCCNRYFEPMAAHMAAKHPQYAGEPLV